MFDKDDIVVVRKHPEWGYARFVFRDGHACLLEFPKEWLEFHSGISYGVPKEDIPLGDHHYYWVNEDELENVDVLNTLPDIQDLI